MKLALKKPIQVGEGLPVTELVFREELCAGDLRGIRSSSLNDPLVEDLLKIAGRLCAQPDPVMHKLGFEDLAEVLGVVGGFLGSGEPTATKPSP